MSTQQSKFSPRLHAIQFWIWEEVGQVLEVVRSLGTCWDQMPCLLCVAEEIEEVGEEVEEEQVDRRLVLLLLQVVGRTMIGVLCTELIASLALSFES